MADNQDIGSFFDDLFLPSAFQSTDTIPLEHDITTAAVMDHHLSSNGELKEPLIPYENTLGVSQSIWTPTNYDAFLQPTQPLGQEEFAILREKNEKLEQYVHIRRKKR